MPNVTESLLLPKRLLMTPGMREKNPPAYKAYCKLLSSGVRRRELTQQPFTTAKNALQWTTVSLRCFDGVA